MRNRRNALLGTMVGLLLVPLSLTGCSGHDGEDSASGGGGGSSAAAAKWGACMRDKGFTVEDPSDEQFSTGVEMVPADVDRAAFGTASKGCRGDAPSGASADDKAGWVQDAEDFSQCMRDNGVADFPDPEEPGSISWDDEDTSPTYVAAVAECKSTVLKGWGGL